MTTLERLEKVLRDGWRITDGFGDSPGNPQGMSIFFEIGRLDGTGSFPNGLGSTLEEAINNCLDHMGGT